MLLASWRSWDRENRDPVSTKPRYCELTAVAALSLVPPGTHRTSQDPTRRACPRAKLPGGATCPGDFVVNREFAEEEKTEDLEERALRVRR